MKKLLTMSALLLVALLLFTGCPKDPAPNGNGLPGTWSQSVQMFTNNRNCWSNKGTLIYDNTNKAFVFNLNAGELTGNDIPDSGKFDTWWFPVTTDANYTGFKATATTTQSTYCGFIFNLTEVSNQWSYYYIVLSDSKFMLKKCINGTSSNILSWTADDAIKPTPQENEVLVYKDTDSSIIIKINGVTVYTITSPEIHEGQCGVVCCVSNTQYNNGTEITTTWKFKEFQR
ncbi:MAG: hypothetical protein J5647_11225 [Spirochaetaceae bacterium]|nr:hypothetical protein [Spirochaetaceae bacterium]